MSDTIVKTERFVNALNEVKLLTVAMNRSDTRDYSDVPNHPQSYTLYYAIVKNGKVEFASNLIYGGSMDDVIRNTDIALQVVRQLLTETGFLTGEVVG